MARYTQVFTMELDAPPEQAWPALVHAVDTMDGAKLGDRDDAAERLSFSTGVSVTSWGQELDVTLRPLTAGSSRIDVRAKPRGTFLTTTWGERMHARTIERRLRSELAAVLPNG